MSAIEDAPAHARLGPSGADRWMVCAGAPNAEEGLPDDESEFAAEGTMAHEVSDLCLTLGFEPFDFVGHTFHVGEYTFEWDDDHAEALLPGIEWTRAQPGQFFGEHRVDLSRWLGEGQFGTLDRGIVAPDLITVADLKFGRGIPVSPVRNRQLMLYALGFWWNVARHLTQATNFLIVIDQPRCAGGGGEWRVTLDELLAFGEEAMVAAERTLDPNAPRTADEKACTFCKRRKAPGGCETYDAFNLDLLGMQFEDLDGDGEPDLPRQMTPERRAWLIRHTKMIEGWLEQHHADHLADALAGKPSGGLKAVAGRANPSKWRDKEAAEAAVTPILGDRSFTKKLITPTQAGKLIPSEDFSRIVEPHVQRGEKKPVLVPEDDARPALLTADQFDDITE